MDGERLGQILNELKKQTDKIEDYATLLTENDTLRKALEIYQRERDRYKHATPEMTKEDFEKLEQFEKQELIAMYRNALLQIEELKKRNSEMGWRLNPGRTGE